VYGHSLKKGNALRFNFRLKIKMVTIETAKEGTPPMSHNTPTMLHEQPTPHDPLSEMLRQGARHLIAQAVEAELQEMLSHHRHRRDPNGRRSVMHNGYLPERELLTGLGPVCVRVPKLRSRDPKQPVAFRLLLPGPPYMHHSKSLEAILP